MQSVNHSKKNNNINYTRLAKLYGRIFVIWFYNILIYYLYIFGWSQDGQLFLSCELLLFKNNLKKYWLFMLASFNVNLQSPTMALYEEEVYYAMFIDIRTKGTWQWYWCVPSAAHWRFTKVMDRKTSLWRIQEGVLFVARHLVIDN